MSLDGGSLSAGGFRRLGPLARSRFWALVALASLLGLASTSPELIARSQECEPSADGCRLEIGQRASAVLADGREVHTWLLQLRTGGDVLIALTDLLVDYDVHVYGPDGELVGESLNEGQQDELVLLSDLPAGEYRIYVNSGRGEAAPIPYTLLAIGPSPQGGEAASPPVGPLETQQPAPATPLVPAASAPGQTLLRFDDFSDPAKGLFLDKQQGTWRFHGTDVPVAWEYRWEYRYEDGSLVARILGTLPPGDPSVQASWAANARVTVPPDFAVEFRARATKAARQMVYAINAQIEGSGDGLRFSFDPWEGQLNVWRLEGDRGVGQIVGPFRPRAVNLPDEENHLRLEVRGQQVAVYMNGVEYGRGAHAGLANLASLGARLNLSWGMVRSGQSEGEVRFDDFKVYALGS